MSFYNPIHRLALKWSTSRGRDTYGYPLLTLTDTTNGQRFRTCGGGYDLQGTVFADWLEKNYQTGLMALAADKRHHSAWDGHRIDYNAEGVDVLYGMRLNSHQGAVVLDGACGLESMLRIAECLGLEVQREIDKRGHLVALFVQARDAGEVAA